MATIEWIGVGPEIAVGLAGLAALCLRYYKGGIGGRWGAYLLLGGCTGGMGLGLWQWETGVETVLFEGLVLVDGRATLIRLLLLGGTGLAALLELGGGRRAESGFMGVATAVAMLGVAATDMRVVALAFAALVLVLRLATGIKRRIEAGEIGGVLACGGALALWLGAGASGMESVAALAALGGGPDASVVTLGLGLLGIGALAWLGLVPFHGGYISLYVGGSSALTVYAATVVRLAGVAVLLRFVQHLPLDAVLPDSLWILAAVATGLANLLALGTVDARRLLGWLGAAQAGYLLCGLTAGGSPGAEATLWAMLAFILALAGVHAVLDAWAEKSGAWPSWAGLSGMGWRHPALGGCMVLFLSGLAAVPPTVSFGGRFLLWEAVAVAGGGGWVWIGLANGLLTAGACARLGMVFLRPAASGTEPASDIASPLAAVVLLCAVLSLWGVLWPEGLLEALRVSG